eukprot:Rhum_TRINITY_DN15525_c0_g1::Rhum_TRINITY_DN15525_c0_g1_i1::g.161112::m.161112/K08342/ATG4; cysteine protease ATG4
MAEGADSVCVVEAHSHADEGACACESAAGAARRKRYRLIQLPDVCEGQAVQPEGDEGTVQGDLRDYVWWCYRDGFAPVSGLSTDRGWGCVHRAGQMMLMTALRRHLQARPEVLYHLFMDSPDAPFSIQRIAAEGEHYGKAAGTWFAPSTLAHVAAALVAAERTVADSPLHPQPLRTYVAVDQCLDRAAVRALAAEGGVLVMIPFMFGIDRINEPNGALLKNFLGSSWCTGVVGGTLKHALYVLGYEEDGAPGSDFVVCLDPHQVQPAFTSIPTLGTVQADPSSPSCFSLIASLEPSSLVCFYAASEAESVALLDYLEGTRLAGSSWPVFSCRAGGGVGSGRVRESGDWDHDTPDLEPEDGGSDAPRRGEGDDSDDEWVAL